MLRVVQEVIKVLSEVAVEVVQVLVGEVYKKVEEQVVRVV